MRLFPIDGPEALALAVLAADLDLPGTPNWDAVCLDSAVCDLPEGAILAARLGAGHWQPVSRKNAELLGENGTLIAAAVTL